MPSLDEESRLYAEQFGQFSGLLGTDLSLAVHRLIHMTPLAEDGKQVGRRLSRMCQQELKPLGRRGLVGRKAVATVVIFYQHAEQVHQLVLSRGPAALAEQIAEVGTDQIIFLIVLDARGHRLGKKLFVGDGWHHRFSRLYFSGQHFLDKESLLLKAHDGYQGEKSA